MVYQGTNCSDQCCSCVSAETILKQSSQFWISVHYKCVLFILSERLNHFSKTRETQIDCFQFKHMLLCHGFTLVNFFAASEIAKIKFSSKQHSLSVWLGWFDEELEDCVGTWGVNVGGCLSGNPRLFAAFQQLEAVVRICDHVLGLSFDKNTRVFVFSDD